MAKVKLGFALSPFPSGSSGDGLPISLLFLSFAAQKLN